MIDEGLKRFATPHQLRVLEALEKHHTQRAAAEALGMAHGSVGDAMQALKKKAARYGYSPEHYMTKPVPDGYKAKGVSSYFDADGKLRGQWVKSSIDEERQRQIMEEAFSAFSQELPRLPPVTAPIDTNAALCNLIVFTDYHLGMLAWEKEGGSNWDVKIAESLLLASFLNMVDRAPNAQKCVLTIQGDFLHSDGLLPLTPAHKHVLDTDGRFSKIVAAAIRVLRKLLDHSLTRYQSVHLVICEGNHDEASSMWLRHMFAALYENEPRLTVNDSELPFYAYRHGETMLAFHHGHKVKNSDLPMLFAAQFPKMWGETTKRYAHTGHRHHVDEKEYSGMTITQHPTLSARDAYSARGGWISERAAVTVTYHEKFGQVSRTISVPEMFE